MSLCNGWCKATERLDKLKIKARRSHVWRRPMAQRIVADRKCDRNVPFRVFVVCLFWLRAHSKQCRQILSGPSAMADPDPMQCAHAGIGLKSMTSGIALSRFLRRRLYPVFSNISLAQPLQSFLSAWLERQRMAVTKVMRSSRRFTIVVPRAIWPMAPIFVTGPRPARSASL